MGRGRLPGFKMSLEHRVKIQNSNVLNVLIEHVEGTRDMSASQVTAGIALLKKVMPDLTDAQFEVHGDIRVEQRDGLTLLMEAVNGRTRTKS
jgi:hypothetical protein